MAGVDVGTIEATLKLRDELSAALRKAADNLGSLGNRARETGKAVSDSGKRVDSSAKSTISTLSSLIRAVQEEIDATKKGAAALLQLKASREADQRIQKLGIQQWSVEAGTIRQLTLSYRTLQNQLKDVTASHAATKSSSSAASGGMSSLLGTVTGGAGVFGALITAGYGVINVLKGIGSAAIEVGKDIFETGSKFEQLRARMSTATGDDAITAAAFEELKEFSASTPFELENLVTAFNKLALNGIAPTQERLRAFGNIAAAQGKSIEEFAHAVNRAIVGELDPIEQFGVQMRVEGDKMRVTSRGVSVAIERDAASIIEHLQKIGETDFAGGMERQSATVAGAASNVQDSFSNMYDGIARQSGLLITSEALMRMLAQGVTNLTPAILALSEAIGATLLPALEVLVVSGAQAVDIIRSLGTLAGEKGLASLLNPLAAGDAVGRSLADASGAVGKTVRSFQEIRTAIDNQRESQAASREELDAYYRRLQETLVAEGKRKLAAKLAEDQAKAQKKLNVELERAHDLLLAASGESGQAAKKIQELISAWRLLSKHGQNATELLVKGLFQISAKLRDVKDGTLTVLDATDGYGDQSRELVKDLKSVGVALDQVKEKARTLQDQFLTAITALNDEVELNIALAGIDEVDPHLAEIERRYIEFLAGLGDGSVTLGEDVFKRLAEKLGESVDSIKDKLRQIDNAKIIQTYKGASKTLLQLYKEERADIERVMKDSTTGVKLSAADGAAALRTIEQRRWGEMLSLADQSFGFLADRFGGFFSYLQQAVGVLQQAQGLSSSVSGLASGLGASSSLASGLGAVAGTFAIFAAIYDGVSSHLERAKAKRFNNAAVFDVGGLGVTLDRQAEGIYKSLGNIVRSLEESLRISIDDLDAISIQVQNNGKKVKAFVAGHLIGVFSSIEDAMSEAIRVALTNGNASIAGLSDLMRNSLEFGSFSDLDDLTQTMRDLREISELSWSDAARGVADTIHHLEQLWKTLAEQKTAGPAAIQGFQDLAGGFIRAYSDWADSLTGRERTDAERLAQLQAEGRIHNAQVLLLRSRIALMKLEAEAEIRRLESQRRLIRDGIELGRDNVRNQLQLYQAEYELWRAELTAKSAFVQTGAEINAQAIELLRAQIAAFDEILANIGTINIDDIRLPDIGRGGGGGGRKQQLASFEDELRQTIQSTLPDLTRQFADARAEMARIRAEAARLRADAALTAGALDAIRQGLVRTIQDMLGEAFAGNDWQRQAQDIRDRWAEVTNAVREHLDATGERLVPFWQIQAAQAAELQRLARSALDSLGNPLRQIRSEFSTLADTLAFLRDAVAQGVISAEELANEMAALGQQTFSRIGNDLLSFIDQWGIEIEGVEDLRRTLTELDIRLKIAGWRLMIQLAAELGTLTDEQASSFGAIIDQVEDQIPGILDSLGDGLDDLDQAAGSFGDSASEAQRAWEQAQSILKKYRDDGLTPYQRDLASLNADFAILRATLGSNKEITTLYTEALARLHDQYTESIRTYLESLLDSEFSPLSVQERFDAAMQRYRSILSDVASGDPSQANALPQLADQLLALFAQITPAASAQFRAFFNQIMSQLAGISGFTLPAPNPLSNVLPFTPSPVSRVASVSSGPTANTSSGSSLVDTVQSTGVAQLHELRLIRAATTSSASSLRSIVNGDRLVRIREAG